MSGYLNYVVAEEPVDPPKEQEKPAPRKKAAPPEE